MTSVRAVACAAIFLLCTGKAWPQGAASLVAELRQLSIDERQTYRARDLTLVRGDIKIYLNDGLLSFFKPVGGRVIAAVFTTNYSELGDAEIIVLPHQRSERASLASFTNTPNLNEHFGSALFFFTDDTAQELRRSLERAAAVPASPVPADFAQQSNKIGRELAAQLEIRVVGALVSGQQPAQGFFYGVAAGQNLRTFHFSYNPTNPEPVSIGAFKVSSGHGPQRYQTWVNYRPRNLPAFVPPPVAVESYRLDTQIREDLSTEVSAELTLTPGAVSGRGLLLELSPRLRVTAAELDGQRAEILQDPPPPTEIDNAVEPFVIAVADPLDGKQRHRLTLHYSGSIIRKTPAGDYFVEDRSVWYPILGTVFSQFDLVFHCPRHLQLISTGEPVSDEETNGIRTVHRKTVVPSGLAGFNLGDYSKSEKASGPYEVSIYTQSAASPASTADLEGETAAVLSKYTDWWGRVPTHSMAVTPISGYFGQGFPGLIYLSSMSYIKQENRPASVRNPRMDSFFSSLLLPHEIAHQWWGNVLRSADYRSAWITEAMANDSALEYLKHTQGEAVRDELLKTFLDDLQAPLDERSKTIDSAGPIDFGERLLQSEGMLAWHVVTYEKGSWILQMLKERLGPENYHQFQLALLKEHPGEPITTEAFRRLAARFAPPDQPDKELSLFFDTWIYGTGIPRLSLTGTGRSAAVTVAGVEDDFIVDIPLRCRQVSGSKITRWLRAGVGSSALDLPKNIASCELPSPHTFLYIGRR